HLGNQVQLEIGNSLHSDLKKYTRLRPTVRLGKITIDNELQHQLGIELDTRIKIFQTVDAFRVRQVVKDGNHPLFQLFGQEHVQKFDRVSNSVGCTAVDVFLYELNRPGIVQHRQQHIDVIDVVLYLGAQRHLYLF